MTTQLTPDGSVFQPMRDPWGPNCGLSGRVDLP